MTVVWNGVEVGLVSEIEPRLRLGLRQSPKIRSLIVSSMSGRAVVLFRPTLEEQMDVAG